MADMLRGLLAGFMAEILEAAPQDLSRKFDPERAQEAYTLVRSTADLVNAMPTVNVASAGFHPRIKVSEHTDIEILHALLTDRARELKDALLSGAGQYALGANHLQFKELSELAEEYVAVGRLTNAVEREHNMWHADHVRQENALPEMAPWEQELLNAHNEANETRISDAKGRTD